MPDWLKNRLSPVKSETPRWIGLAAAIESFFEQNHDPDFEYLKSLRSIFSATPEGQALILRSLGGYFEDNLPDENIPVAVTSRQYDLLMKQTTIPLEDMIVRVGSEATYEPLWGRDSDVYGAAFYVADELLPTRKLDGTWKISGLSPEKLYPRQFMTSRAVIAVNLNSVTNFGDLDIIRQRAAMLRPAHIVLDGFRYAGRSEETIQNNIQPKLDGTWKFQDPTEIMIKAYPLTHDYMLSVASSARMNFAPTSGMLPGSSVTTPVKVIDNGDNIEFWGVAQPHDFVGETIGAAGLYIDGNIHAPFIFLPKEKAIDDSYQIKITLRFR